MCGIAGVLVGDRQAAERLSGERLAGMLRAIRHRGPDDWGAAFFGIRSPEFSGDDPHVKRIPSPDVSLALGHQRLSILDLSAAGRQPMLSEDGSCCVTFNGEIYNYIELRDELARHARFRTRTDTEVLLEAYRQWDMGMLPRLDGMFAFALWDARKRKLICARDPIGIKPFYWAQQEGNFVFASEPRAVLAGLGTRGTVDEVRVAEFLVLGVSDHDEGTSYKEIRQLQGGHFLEVDCRGSISQPRQFWRAPESQAQAGPDVPTLVRERVETAVHRQLRSDVPVGSCLSGGLDSGSIVGTIGSILGCRSSGFTALTLTNSGFAADEAGLACATARRAKVKWEKVRLDEQRVSEEIRKLLVAIDEPCPSLSMLGQRKVMERASELGLKVMLDGQGGDEVFLGYPRVALRLVGERFAKGKILAAFRESNGFRRNASQSTKNILLSNLVFGSPGFLYWRNKRRAAKLVDQAFLEQARPETARQMYGNAQNLSDVQVGELTRFCLPQLLRFEDRSSMAFGVEARVPLLSVGLVEFALGLPLKWKIRDGWTKYALRSGMSGLLPDEIVWCRKKRGFEVPQKNWVEGARSEITEWLASLPQHSPIKRREILAHMDAGRAGEDWFWRCLCVALWLCFSGARL